MIDARKFWTMCRLHDWHYMMSEDPEVYRDGVENEKLLASIAAQSPAHAEVYAAWYDHNYGTGPRPPEPKLDEV